MSARSGRPRMRGLRPRLLAAALTFALPFSALAGDPVSTDEVAPRHNGVDIYQRFRGGLAEPQCDAAATSARWKKQFSHAPGQLVRPSSDVLPLFGYVVEALREADLPTEFALIPFVESGYQPGSRNPSGPAGLWQFVTVTARNHGVPIRTGYDGRLSPVESTQAAVRYLKTLHGMFGGDWRLAVMAYNAGEYRVLQSMRRAGMNAQNARPAELPGLSKITYAYVEKLHALACIFQQADDRDDWMRQLDRDVPRLAALELPKQAGSLSQWAESQGYEVALIQRLNPALNGKLPRTERPLRVLAPAQGAMPAFADAASLVAAQTDTDQPPSTVASTDSDVADPAAAPAKRRARSHTVRRGESAWTIAKRYGIKPQALLSLNGLKGSAVLKPGMVLAIDESR